MLSRRWMFKSRYSGLWRRVVVVVVVEYQRFGAPCCLSLQGEDGGSMDLWNVRSSWSWCRAVLLVGYQIFGAPCCLSLQGEDGGSMDLRNVDILPLHYTASQSRRPQPDAREVGYVLIATSTMTSKGEAKCPAVITWVQISWMTRGTLFSIYVQSRVVLGHPQTCRVMFGDNRISGSDCFHKVKSKIMFCFPIFEEPG
jgi:hypothetical protein